VNVDPLTVLYYSTDDLCGLGVFFRLGHPIHSLLVDPEAWVPRCMLLNSPGPNREEARIRIASQLFLCERFVQPIVHFSQLVHIWRQHRVLGSNGPSNSQTCEEAPRAQQAKELADIFLEEARTFV
jgi:hypothetical protein